MHAEQPGGLGFQELRVRIPELHRPRLPGLTKPARQIAKLNLDGPPTGRVHRGVVGFGPRGTEGVLLQKRGGGLEILIAQWFLIK